MVKRHDGNKPPQTIVWKPRLPRGVRLKYDETRGEWLLLAPERVIKADAIAVEILQRCDGAATIEAIVDDLAAQFSAGRARIERMCARCWTNSPPSEWWTYERPCSGKHAAPVGLLAELTHRCPLGCPYCSNPLELDARADELDTSDWKQRFFASRGAWRAARASFRRRAGGAA